VGGGGRHRSDGRRSKGRREDRSVNSHRKDRSAWQRAQRALEDNVDYDALDVQEATRDAPCELQELI